MKNVVMFVAALALAVPAAAAAETWKGTIGDSMCGLKHSADKHEGTGADHRACVQKCIKGGGEYVFIAGSCRPVFSHRGTAGGFGTIWMIVGKRAGSPPRFGFR